MCARPDLLLPQARRVPDLWSSFPPLPVLLLLTAVPSATCFSSTSYRCFRTGDAHTWTPSPCSTMAQGGLFWPHSFCYHFSGNNSPNVYLRLGTTLQFPARTSSTWLGKHLKPSVPQTQTWSPSGVPTPVNGITVPGTSCPGVVFPFSLSFLITASPVCLDSISPGSHLSSFSLISGAEEGYLLPPTPVPLSPPLGRPFRAQWTMSCQLTRQHAPLPSSHTTASLGTATYGPSKCSSVPPC